MSGGQFSKDWKNTRNVCLFSYSSPNLPLPHPPPPFSWMPVEEGGRRSGDGSGVALGNGEATSWHLKRTSESSQERRPENTSVERDAEHRSGPEKRSQNAVCRSYPPPTHLPPHGRAQETTVCVGGGETQFQERHVIDFLRNSPELMKCYCVRIAAWMYS